MSGLWLSINTATAADAATLQQLQSYVLAMASASSVLCMLHTRLPEQGSHVAVRV
jgi:hypothetical protein